jgi:hypothetical protein
MRCASDPLLVRKFLAQQDTSMLILGLATGLPEGAAIALSRDLPSPGSTREAAFAIQQQRRLVGKEALQDVSLAPSQFEPSLDDLHFAFDLYVEEPKVTPVVRSRLRVPTLFMASSLLLLLLLSVSV